MVWIDIDGLIKEVLYIRASNDELTRRVQRLELEVEELARRERDRLSVRYMQGSGLDIN